MGRCWHCSPLRSNNRAEVTSTELRPVSSVLSESPRANLRCSIGLAQVRLAQGDAVQAEQLSRRGLSYASDRPALQASLWELIAQARERQGNAAGAAQARERAKVSM
jgi:predicted Zn-dependent protease